MRDSISWENRVNAASRLFFAVFTGKVAVALRSGDGSFLGCLVAVSTPTKSQVSARYLRFRSNSDARQRTVCGSLGQAVIDGAILAKLVATATQLLVVGARRDEAALLDGSAAVARTLGLSTTGAARVQLARGGVVGDAHLMKLKALEVLLRARCARALSDRTAHEFGLFALLRSSVGSLRRAMMAGPPTHSFAMWQDA